MDLSTDFAAKEDLGLWIQCTSKFKRSSERFFDGLEFKLDKILLNSLHNAFWLYQSFDHGRCHEGKLWYMARIGIYFIFRTSREKKIRTGNPPRQERKCNGLPGKGLFLKVFRSIYFCFYPWIMELKSVIINQKKLSQFLTLVLTHELDSLTSESGKCKMFLQES